MSNLTGAIWRPFANVGSPLAFHTLGQERCAGGSSEQDPPKHEQAPLASGGLFSNSNTLYNASLFSSQLTRDFKRTKPTEL